MRKTVGDPHQRKLQARCTAKIQKSVAFSAGMHVCSVYISAVMWCRAFLFVHSVSLLALVALHPAGAVKAERLVSSTQRFC